MCIFDSYVTYLSHYVTMAHICDYNSRHDELSKYIIEI